MNLTKAFNKFAGREIQVIEKPYSIDIGGKTYTGSEALLDKNDPTVAEMKKLAEDNGLRLRLWLPGSAGTMDFRTDRVNAHVEKGADGKYRVSNKFNIG